MKMTNNEIYTTANQLVAAFNDNAQRLPIKINFYLQKNIKVQEQQLLFLIHKQD